MWDQFITVHELHDDWVIRFSAAIWHDACDYKTLDKTPNTICCPFYLVNHKKLSKLISWTKKQSECMNPALGIQSGDRVSI